MEKHQFTLTLSGSKQEATQKVNALAVLATKLDTNTLIALAKVVQQDPGKVALAKSFLGIK